MSTGESRGRCTDRAPVPSRPRARRGETVEDPLPVALRNGRPFVVHCDLDMVRLARDADAHGLVWSTMHDRVHRQVREQLLHPAGIPLARSFTLHLEHDLAPGMRSSRLLDDLGGGLRQVHRSRRHRDAPSQPPAGEIEQIVDHARHPLRAGADTRKRLVLRLGESGLPQLVGGAENGLDGAAQVMAEDADEALAKRFTLAALRLGAPALGEGRANSR